jgi:hypothetical protein
MPPEEVFGWRDRAIALASLGAASLGRAAFATADVIGEKPLRPVEMQVLVALALQDSLAAEPPQRTDTNWVSRALGLEEWVVEEVLGGLVRAQLVQRCSEARAVLEIDEPADTGGEDVVAAELPVAVTGLGLQAVASWLDRTRRHFDSWPSARPDVDDVVA